MRSASGIFRLLAGAALASFAAFKFVTLGNAPGEMAQFWGYSLSSSTVTAILIGAGIAGGVLIVMGILNLRRKE